MREKCKKDLDLAFKQLGSIQFKLSQSIFYLINNRKDLANDVLTELYEVVSKSGILLEETKTRILKIIMALRGVE